MGIRNVKGDVHALLSSLQKTLGTGGDSQRGGSIEIQGEHHLEKVRIFCLNSGCVLGASKKNKDYAAKIAKGGGNNGNGNGKNGNNKKNNNSETNNNNNNNNNESTKIINATTIISVKETKTMKPVEMKVHLTARGLPTQGNKKELLARLLIAIQ